ncbi:hypothetical protein [uncultured Nostoc sp.]|uniref:hypothetical protein n=1 Tax=uncultured Nostoc sp. TaxID=340711 RepID=UPI0035CBC78B
MKNLWQNFHIFGWGLIGATLVLQPTSAQAQYIQRSFLNPSFEQPVFGTSCYIQVDESQIPGWTTTHSTKQGTASCATTGFTTLGHIIEIWTKGFSSVNTATGAGNQFAELNAEENSELYQSICLIQNETITFSLLHRGRNSSTTRDVAQFLIGTSIFGTFSTSNSGATDPPVAGTGAGSISQSSAANGWVRYSGTVNYSGGSSNQNVGFKAFSAAGGATQGNFLDEVQFAGKPVVEFTASSGGAAESETTPTTNPPKLRIVGLVPTGGISVPISVSGTAVLGTDYTTTSGTSTFNLNIPAGNYDGSDATSVFTIPFTVINNNIPQGVRTIVFTIQTSTSFFASSTTTCGGSPTSASNYTIYDDDFLSGKVWNDADNSANGTFTNINTGSETGTNAGGLLNAILVDSNNKVLKTTTVAADGTYTFLDVPLNQSNVKILLSTTAGTVGNTAPTASLPPNWVNTSPLTTAAFNTGTNISSKDFGIERLPDTTNLNPASQTNPGGTATVQVPTLAGTDPEDGALGSGNKFKIVTLPTNGTLTYNNVAVTAGQIISNYNPTLLKLDPQDGAITVSFTYAAIDAASKEDATPATVTIPFITPANVLLVKRITAINGDRTKNPNDNTPLNAFVDDTTSTRKADDNNANWKSGYLLGAIDGGKVKPGDEIEYTIYFLNAGSSNANTVKICDRISANQNFKGSAYGTNKDIQLQLGTSTVLDLTSASDTSDRAQLISAGGTVPANCYLKAANDNGTLVIDVTGNTGVPNLTTMPGSTAQGSPNDSYGFLRFVTKVKP